MVASKIQQQQKSIDSFFAPKYNGSSANLPSKTELEVPGLILMLNFISKDEEQQILDFLSNQKWRTDLARRVIHYGGSYCLMPPRDASSEQREKIESQIITADPIPTYFDFLITRMVEHNIYERHQIPEFCIVNEYKEKQGISAHVENFRFAEPVCGLTLGNGDYMRFHELVSPDDGSVRSGKAAKAEKTGHRRDLWLPSRSLLIMTGSARYNWQHEICRSKRGRDAANWKRTSLTFRTLQPKASKC